MRMGSASASAAAWEGSGKGGRIGKSKRYGRWDEEEDEEEEEEEET